MKIIINKLISLEKVNKSKKINKELYFLFKSRPKSHYISAKKETKFKDHKKFIKNNPYRYWFIIKYNEKYIGTIYFTFENSIGFFILNKYLKFSNQIFSATFKKIKPLPYKLSMRQKYFTINISPKNKKYKKIIKGLGGRVIQNTYIFRKI
tara:strand:- start:874 stop:1326 length:453 start_codon:yes stop_codon:yes gene_type:complete